ncbi:MAG: outer membrane beta-barrel protein [Planctomycetota bacterium]
MPRAPHDPRAPRRPRLQARGWPAAAAMILAGPPIAADDFADGIFEPRSGLYVAGTYGFFDDYDVRSNDVFNSSDEFVLKLEDSTSFTAAIGTVLGSTRLEFEYGRLETDTISLDTIGFTNPVSGDLSYDSFMGNLFYDFKTPLDRLSLYLGAGAGFTIIDLEGDLGTPINTVDGSGNIIATRDKVDNGFSTFTYQFMAGLGYEIIDNVVLTGGYRIRVFSEAGDNSEFGGARDSELREHDIQTLEFGLRIEF